MKASVFVGTSVDGFIARADHTFDFLPDDVEDHGYSAFMASVDAMVIGRNTYDVVRSFEQWPYGGKPVFVLSSRPFEMPPSAEAVVARMEGDPSAIMRSLEDRGFQHLYVDGGVTIQKFLRAGLIQRLVITRVPVLIGTGIPLFGHLPHDVKLQHVSTRHFPSGLVQSEYVLMAPTELPA